MGRTQFIFVSNIRFRGKKSCNATLGFSFRGDEKIGLSLTPPSEK